MNPSQIVRARMRNERLIGAPFERPEDVVSWLGAVQSQDYAGAKWALAQRCSPGVTNSDVDRLFNEGKILRTHVMRPTWHFVAPTDLRWLLKLTAPRVHQVSAYMRRQLELDAATFRRGNAALTKALQGGAHLTREEIGTVFKKARIIASGPRLAYLVAYAELEGLICSGPLRGKQHTYALLEERVPPARPLDYDEALAELSRRFFTSHGPAEIPDFAWWSGLTLTEARKGVESVKAQLIRSDVGGREYWSGAIEKVAPPRKPVVHLLPNYDEFVGSFRDNTVSIAPDVRKKLRTHSEALMVNIVTSNGRVVGGWRRTASKREIVIATQLLVPLSTQERTALAEAAKAYGRFMQLPVTVIEG